MENNEQLALKRSLYSAKKTFWFQFGTAVLTIAIGISIITISSNWAGSLGLNLSYANSKVQNFKATAFISTASFLVFIWVITNLQFEDAIPQENILKATIISGVIPAVVVSCALSLFMLIPTSLELVIIQFFFQLMQLMILVLVTGFLQKIRLRIENFDRDEHLWLLSNEADLNACKLHILPYRQKIKAFWGIVAVLIFITFWGAWFYIMLSDDYTILQLLITVGVTFLSIYLLIKVISRTFNPTISSREGQVTKKYIPRQGRYNPEQFILVCNLFEYHADARTWDIAIDSNKYRLWLFGTNTPNARILAIELLEVDLHSLSELKDQEKMNLSGAS